MPNQPEDHKPAKGEPFKFTGSDGKKHTLPPLEVGRKSLTGRDLRDAALGGEAGQVGYMLKILEYAKPNPKALDALYDMSQGDMLEVLKGWGEHGDGDGASLGES
ncbi:hypothetical protein [Nocardioides terrigena]|uniref:hypothetical protein n=1 Tax=Nocardioides terrigena TaxID=424797 RepID=UPI000D30D9B7|nr:hypothetical protein [Nocardioides terrigena]